MLERTVLCWLLRVLGDDAFLPIYLGDGERRPPPESREQLQFAIESAFWGLVPDYEHPEAQRKQTWDDLQRVIDGVGYQDPPVSAFYRGLVKLLLPEMCRPEHAELARFWAWPELANPPEDTPLKTPYNEIHAHFRGSVPIDQLWLWMMTDARARAQLRHKVCTIGIWSRTRAELVEVASELRLRLRPSSIQEDDEAGLRRYCMARRDLCAVQYLALYANLRRFLLHQRGRTGLVSFSKSFDVISTLTKRGTRGRAQRQMDRDVVVAILERFEASGTNAVELRPTLDATHDSNLRKLKSIVLGYFDYLGKSSEPVTLGLVPSLYKQEVIGRVPFHGCARDDDLRGRLVQQLHVWRRQVESLLEAIRTVPLLRMFVVGIDAAGLEMGAPVRALAPAFALVHDYHRRWNLVDCPLKRAIPVRSLKRKLAEIRGDLAPEEVKVASDALWERLDGADSPLSVARRRLGLTVHAGEDFIDPTTGLREVWEAVDHLKLGDHDRIGHAIALSLDGQRLRELLRQRGESEEISTVEALESGRWRLRKPIGVHVLDVAWSASLRSSPERAELAHVTSRALGVLPMHRAVHESLSNAAFPTSVLVPGVCFLHHNVLEPEHWCWVYVDDAWCSAFEELRQVVIAKVRRTGIVIESCPTSNRVVANLDEPPIFGLLAIEPEIRCAVATDDPGVLDAWPEHELARLDASTRDRVLRANAVASFVRSR